MVRKGVTTVEIKSGYGLSPDAEAKMLRAAKECNDTARIVTTFLGAHALPKEFRDNRKGYVQQVINDQLPIIQKYNLADNVDVFCDSIGFTQSTTLVIVVVALALFFAALAVGTSPWRGHTLLVQITTATFDKTSHSAIDATFRCGHTIHPI